MRALTSVVLLACACASSPGRPAPAPSTAPAAAPTAPSVPAPEHIGPLYLGIDEASALRALGEPAEHPPARREQSGVWSRTITWPAHGLTVMLVSAEEAGPYQVGLVVMFTPGGLRTARGLGIGSSADEVRTTYSGSIVFTNEAMVKAQVGDDELSFGLSPTGVALIALGRPGSP